MKKRTWSTKVVIPNFHYKKTCDKCGKKATHSFRGRDGKMHGACKKHLKEIG